MKYKKIILGSIAGVITTVIPLSAIVSCGDSSKRFEKEKVSAGKQFLLGHYSFASTNYMGSIVSLINRMDIKYIPSKITKTKIDFIAKNKNNLAEYKVQLFAESKTQPNKLFSFNVLLNLDTYEYTYPQFGPSFQYDFGSVAASGGDITFTQYLQGPDGEENLTNLNDFLKRIYNTKTINPLYKPTNTTISSESFAPIYKEKTGFLQFYKHNNYIYVSSRIKYHIGAAESKNFIQFTFSARFNIKTGITTFSEIFPIPK